MNDACAAPDLIVALDVPDAAALDAALTRLPSDLDFFKVGLELYCAAGASALAALRARGARIFLDLKFHDIPRTVERAVRAAAAPDIALMTVHAAGGPAMIRAAADAARALGPRRPRIVAVTVLTSLDAADLAAIGIGRTPAEEAIALAELAMAGGADGVVCSAQEVGALRRRLGPQAYLVTPGIRLPGGEAGDQKRTATPAAAARDGASAIVVGRPILEAADPAAAARAIRQDARRGKG